MPFTLRDFLETPLFKDFKVLAGSKGLSRVVTSVSVMDAPDIKDWLKGGEILMTTGYIMRNNISDFYELVQDINRKNAAALFVKMSRFIDDLPQGVYDLADELGFPIVFMPIRFAFTDVINPVLSQLVNEQTRRLELSENIHRSFTDLVLSGGETKQIIDTLGEIISESVAYIDLEFGNDSISSGSEIFVSIIKKRNLEKILSTYRNYAVCIAQKKYGYIVYSNTRENRNDFIDIAVENASTVIKLNIQKKISNIEIEKRHKAELVQDIIFHHIKNANEISSKTNLYGVSFSNGVYVVIMEIRDYLKMKTENMQKHELTSLEAKKEKVFEICADIMKGSYYNLLFSIVSGDAVFLIEPSSPPDGFCKSFKSVAENICGTIYDHFHLNIFIGVGNYRKSIAATYQSYQEAKFSVRIGSTLYDNSRSRIVFYKDIGVYRLIEILGNTREALDFCNDSIGKIIAHDRKFKTELFQTLLQINECNWNLKSASAKMYLHYNTVKYRYKRIEEILDIDLGDSEQRFIISLTIKLIRMNPCWGDYLGKRDLKTAGLGRQIMEDNSIIPFECAE